MGPAGPAAQSSLTQDIGAWTPILGGTTGESGQAYSTQRGYYVRTGKLVHLWCYLQLSAKGVITGPLLLKGFPFPAALVPMFFAGVNAYYSNLSPAMANSPVIFPYGNGGCSYAFLYTPVPSSNPRQLLESDINDHTQMTFSISYFTD